MITIKDINNAPAILNEKDRDFTFQRLDALKVTLSERRTFIVN